MYCTNCGSKMGDSDRFCSRCGQKTALSAPPPDPNPEEDGDEAVLYRQGLACYFTRANAWITGAFVIANGYIVFYPRRFIRTFRIFFNEINAISHAYVRHGYACFSISTKDGRMETFSVESADIAETQVVVEQLRLLSGVTLVFQ